MCSTTPIRPLFTSAQSSPRLSRTCLQTKPTLNPLNPRIQQQQRWKTTVERRIRPLANETGQSDDDNAQAMPRWMRTPPAMRAPFRTRPVTSNTGYEVNESSTVLDEVYVNLLGRGGEKMLDEEVKWLAVTHKSFDHGRRGFNDRLAFLGE